MGIVQMDNGEWIAQHEKRRALVSIKLFVVLVCCNGNFFFIERLTRTKEKKTVVFGFLW